MLSVLGADSGSGAGAGSDDAAGRSVPEGSTAEVLGAADTSVADPSASVLPPPSVIGGAMEVEERSSGCGGAPFWLVSAKIKSAAPSRARTPRATAVM